MQSERSQQNRRGATTSVDQPLQPGTLYVVALPIGHPGDITARAIQTLKQVDIIAAEDPAALQPLLFSHQIDTTVTSYGPRNLEEKVTVLLQQLRQGKDVALVSDCGSPIIADPGHLFVDAAHAQEVRVVPIPGPSALIAAVTASGLAGDSFAFLGQLPTAQSSIRRCVAACVKSPVPTVAFCTYQSATNALRILAETTPQRLVVLACDLSTVNEQIIRGTPRALQQKLREGQGQAITLVLAGTARGASNAPTRRRVQSQSSRRIKTR